jgi:hypothetical protein
MSDTLDNLVLLEAAAEALKAEFIGWQCRLRQLAMRQSGGRPSAGMRPRALSPAGDEISSGIVVLINKAEPKQAIQQFRYQVLKTQDPIERYDNALEIMAGMYFQRPYEFSDVMTALFGEGSDVMARLLNFGKCVLAFEQFSQSYRLPCRARLLAPSDELYQATYWHNRLFNPHMPPDIGVVSFTPDWTHAGGARVERD